jgi:hypothetical protein
MRCAQSTTTFILMVESDLATRSVAAVTDVVTDIEAASQDAATAASIHTCTSSRTRSSCPLPAGPLVLREPGGRLRGRTESGLRQPEYRVGEACSSS